MADITDLDGRRVDRLRLKDDGGAALVSASLRGDLKEYMRTELRAAGGAVRTGIRKTMRGMKRGMDKQMQAAGIKKFKRGRSEWWIGILYNSKKNGGLDTVGKVYSGFRKAAGIFDTGGRIKPRNGKYLFIQNPDGLPVTIRGLKTLGDRIAVVDSKKPTTKLVILKGSSGSKPLVLGWLVTQVRIKKMTDFDREANQWHAYMPGAIVEEWQKNAESFGIK